MDLIRNASETICGTVNVFLENIDRRPVPWVTLTSLVDHDGTLNPAARDTVVMTIYNITRESFISGYQPSPPAPLGGAAATAGVPVKSPPLFIDLHVMFMANFTEKSYAEGLSALSRVISFFQQNPTLTQQNAPALAPEIARLTLDLENLTPVDVNYVMSILGTKYLPSVFYQVRLLTFDSSAMLARTYPVSGPDATLQRAAQ